MKTTFENIPNAAWARALTFLLVTAAAPARAQTAAPAAAPAPSKEAADTLRLVTEFEVNGLSVLVKRREGSQSVVAGLFLRGGARNVTAENAGVEALMLDVATEARQKDPPPPPRPPPAGPTGRGGARRGGGAEGGGRGPCRPRGARAPSKRPPPAVSPRGGAGTRASGYFWLA